MGDGDTERQEKETPSGLSKTVGQRAARKQAARARPPRSAWFGLGMFGLVGWSIAVPTVIGISIGVWLDARLQGQASWTLTLLIMGVALGCVNAWYWIRQEGDDD
ncbi:MAG: AtpZ/AtpI family protein [Halioglobus sp.]|nr:AtpZ/AtpI family protein [Halioglobus sp.]